MAASGPDGQKRPWLLMAAGIAAVLLVNAAAAAYVSGSITERLLAREGQLKQEFLNSLLEAGGGAEGLFGAGGTSPRLQAFSAHVRSLPGIIRANIYSPDGFIRHSTEPNLIGVHFNDNADLAHSFEGRISTSLELAEASSKPEHLALNQLEGEKIVESYIPVTAKDGKVAAVVEFYRRDDWVGETVSAITRAVWLAAGLSSAILALTLLLAFRRTATARPS